MPYYYWDPTYVLVIAAMLLSMFASFGVNTTFNKYKKQKTARNITGAEAARRVLDMNGLQHIRIERVSGNLTDHFDPKAGVIRLSDATYDDTSVAAVGVAAHEAGHAVQHAVGYAPIKIRNSIIPVVNIGNALSMPLFLIGLLLNMLELAYLGVILFSLTLVFQVVTLPVEFNASRRAIAILDNSMLLYEDEIKPAKKVLKAAAMTYVAAVAATALQLLRFLLIIGSRRDD